jgi:hypothetical protein
VELRVRYWKGTYDEDSERNRDLRRTHLSVSSSDSFEDDDDRWGLRWFHLLIALQAAMVTLAGLLFVTSR